MKFVNYYSSFDPKRAGQAAAFFLLQQSGKMNVLKLVKLIYLADREYMRKFEEPMLGDKFVSMPHGPVNSLTYSCICQGEDGWDDFVGGRIGHFLTLTRDSLVVGDLEDLSDADIEVLSKTWGDFGHMNEWELVDYTHKFCPEWEDPGESSTPIPYARVFKFLAKENSEELERRILFRKDLDRALVRAKCPA